MQSNRYETEGIQIGKSKLEILLYSMHKTKEQLKLRNKLPGELKGDHN